MKKIIFSAISSILMMSRPIYAEEVIGSNEAQKKDIQGLTVQVVPIGAVQLTNINLGGPVIFSGMATVGNLIASAVGGGVQAGSNSSGSDKITIYSPDGKAAYQDASYTQVQDANLQIYLSSQSAINLTKCKVNPSLYKKVLGMDRTEPRAISSWYKNAEANIVTKADIDTEAKYLVETRLGEIKITSTTYGDDVKVTAYAKLYKLPQIEYVDKFTFSGYKYLKHYKNNDPQRNEEIVGEIKNLLDLGGIEIAKEICDTTMTYYMSDSGQRVYIPKK